MKLPAPVRKALTDAVENVRARPYGMPSSPLDSVNLTPEQVREAAGMFPREALTDEHVYQVETFLNTLRNDPSRVTDDMFASAHLNDAQRKLVDLGYDLDLSAEARMQRADEYWPETGYHGTYAGAYDTPITAMDGGFHMGAYEAADDMLRGRATERGTPMYSMYNTGLAEVAEEMVETMPPGISPDNPAYFDFVKSQWVPREQAVQSAGTDSFRSVSTESYADNRGVNDYTYGIVEFTSPEQVQRVRDFGWGAGQYPEGARITPYRYNLSNPLEFDEDLGDWTGDAIADYITRDPYGNYPIPDMEPDFPNRLRQGGRRLRRTENVHKALMEEYGIDGFRYPNTVEGTPGDESVSVFTPRQVREQYAARFDPRLRHIGNTLAGGTGVGLTYGILEPSSNIEWYVP